MRRSLAVLMILLLESPTIFAVNFYVRDGASGAANGANWTDAFDQVTSAEAACSRGDTIYVADGLYNAVDFDVAASGATVITVKKATIADHGTDTGWDNSFGNGQAEFNATIEFGSPNWVFDGMTRDESSPESWRTATSSYGFKINNAQEQQLQSSNTDNDNVKVRYVWFDAPNSALPGTTIRRYAVDLFDNDFMGSFTGWEIDRCLFKNGNVHIFIPHADGIIIQRNAFDSNASNGANHGESVSAYFGSNGAIYRWNYFHNISGTAAIATIADSIEVYGNIGYGVVNGADGFCCFLGDDPGESTTNSKFYNNTIINSGAQAGLMMGDEGSGNSGLNNLFIDNDNNDFQNITHNFSGFDGVDAHGEANAQTGLTTAIFVNYAGKDFRLQSNTTAGSSLGSPYNLDILGNTRTTWSRGAFEFDSGGGGTTGSTGATFSSGVSISNGVTIQ